MTDDDFRLLAERGRESRNVEFKIGGPIRDDQLLRRVLRAVLGMSNTQDGGHVILGVTEGIAGAAFVGMSLEDARTWSVDSFGDKSASWVDPEISVDIDVKVYRDSYFVVIGVAEFAETPVFASKGYRSAAGDMVLREGALYIRGGRKPETIEVRTSAEMRRLLSLALEKRLSQHFRLVNLTGSRPVQSPPQTDDDRFAEQSQGFLS